MYTILPFLSAVGLIGFVLSYQEDTFISEFCTQFQNGSKGNIHYELHKKGSEFLFCKIGSKDVLVQTDPLEDYSTERNVENPKRSLKGGSSDAVIAKSEVVENEINDENSTAERKEKFDRDGENLEVIPAKRKRGRPRKVDTDKVKLEKEVNGKPNVVEITASQVNQHAQSVIRVSARVRDRILTGKYKDFSEIMECKIKAEDETKEKKTSDAVVKMKENLPKVVYDCNMCSYVSTSLEMINNHKIIHDHSKKFTCDTCDFSTSKTRLYQDHKREHMHSENVCSFCGWMCELSEEPSTAFQEHLAKHSGPEPYFCTVCDLRFKTKTKLQLHTPKHSKIKPFVCDQCGASFKWKHALKNHMIVHKKSKDYLCDFCGFSTAHKSQMTAHRLIHTGETFKCSEPGCTFIATRKNYLRYHMLTHTHEKPHQCEVCGQSFSLIKNMKRHMLLHNTAKANRCEKCSFSTTRFDKLKEHYWKQHNIGAPPGKKFRLKDYLDLKPSKPVSENGLAGYLESSEVPMEETQTFELQIQDGGIVDEASASVTYLESSSGEALPVAFTQVGDGAQVAEVYRYPDMDAGCYQTVYVTQVEVASGQ